jgi:hypothetical protein
VLVRLAWVLLLYKLLPALAQVCSLPHSTFRVNCKEEEEKEEEEEEEEEEHTQDFRGRWGDRNQALHSGSTAKRTRRRRRRSTHKIPGAGGETQTKLYIQSQF